MQIFRLFGILAVFGAPGIILGGLTYHLSRSWFAVVVFEIILIIVALKTAIGATCKCVPGGNEH